MKFLIPSNESLSSEDHQSQTNDTLNEHSRHGVINTRSERNDKTKEHQSDSELID